MTGRLGAPGRDEASLPALLLADGELKAAVERAVDIWSGKAGGSQEPDAEYHDLAFQHRCAGILVILLDPHLRGVAEPALSQRHARLAVVAAYWQQVGLVKDVGDPFGTGGKHLLTHQIRGGLKAGDGLRALGWPERDVAGVVRLIQATVPNAVLEALPFASPIERKLGDLLREATDLAQLADPLLAQNWFNIYREYRESADHLRILPERRVFPSAGALNLDLRRRMDALLRRLREAEGQAEGGELKLEERPGLRPYVRQMLENRRALNAAAAN